MKINHRRAARRASKGQDSVLDSSRPRPTRKSTTNEPPRPSKSSRRPNKAERAVDKCRRVQKLSLGEISVLESRAAANLSDRDVPLRDKKKSRAGSRLTLRPPAHPDAPKVSAYALDGPTNDHGLPWRLDGPVPIRVWTPHLESDAASQTLSFARLSVVHPKGLALMPDVHPGAAVPVGLVLPTRAALVPRSVGGDIGCGVAAVRLDLTARHLPDHLRPMRLAIEERVPVGAAHHAVAPTSALWSGWSKRLDALADRCPGLFSRGPSRKALHMANNQLGTLGGGNHFVEVCLDESQQVWLMVHSGSRGLGQAIGLWFIDQAQRWCEKEGRTLPNRGLGYLVAGDPLFAPYEEALSIAQDFAAESRRLMLDAALKGLEAEMGRAIVVTQEAVRCHHNYVAKEMHDGEEVYITRKGAISARAGELGIIPGSMGTESFIVRGKGNPASWCSCSHGAGRRMSRSQASERYTAADVRVQTRGVECRKDRSVVDEIPGAYKPIRDVMAHQSDLVEIVHTLKQVVCIKG